jgi:hypothetical protein
MAYCPRCGDPLSTSPDGRLRCAAGVMPLSGQLSNEIAWFVSGELIETTSLSIPVGGEWHCPADGALLDEKDGRLYCSRCARFLPARIWYQIVEYHRHR